MGPESYLPPLSILIEVLVVILGIAIATRGKKVYGWLFSLTFSLYVLYDLASYLHTALPQWLLQVIFLVASLSIFSAVWLIYRDIRPG